MPYADKNAQRKAQREYARRNRRVINEKRDVLRIKTALYIRSKKKQACTDCGEQYPPWVMDFHHVRGTKALEVSKMPNKCTPFVEIDAEIAKCDLLCANCHRLRHGDPLGDRLTAGQETLNL